MGELLLIVGLLGERVAISSEHVDSVVEIEAMIPVPRAAPHVLGLAALRSRVFTVIDPAGALGLGCSAKSESFDAVLVRSGGHLYALRVDSIEDGVERAGEIASIEVPLLPEWSRVARGMVEVGEDLLLLIDVHALLAGQAAEALSAV